MKLMSVLPSDIEMVNQWRASHGAKPVPTKAIPPTSFLVWDKNTPALFFSMYLTNSDVCFLESFTANPELTGKEIHEAVSYASLEIDRLAGVLKAGWLWAFTDLRGMLKIAKRSGYYQLSKPHYSVMKKIGD